METARSAKSIDLTNTPPTSSLVQPHVKEVEGEKEGNLKEVEGEKEGNLEKVVGWKKHRTMERRRTTNNLEMERTSFMFRTRRDGSAVKSGPSPMYKLGRASRI